MQPQSAPNMYIQSGGATNNGSVRQQQQQQQQQPQGNIYRAQNTSNTGPRNASRPVQMMYPQAQPLHPVIPYSQYTHAPRQTYQPAQYQFSQPHIPQHPYYQFQYYQVPQSPHQRAAVSLNTSVTNPMSVQGGPNGPLTGPAAGQAQIALPTATVLAGGVPPTATGPVLQAGTSVSPLVGVMGPQGGPPLTSHQKSQQQPRLRKHALQIVDPVTHKNILDDLDLAKGSSTSESDSQEHQQQAHAAPAVLTTPPHSLQHDALIGQAPSDHTQLLMNNTGMVVVASSGDARSNMSYNLDVHQMSQQQQQQQTLCQTPVVSAMSDAPSVEILPTPPPLKARTKKVLQIIAPKDEQQNAQKYPSKGNNNIIASSSGSAVVKQEDLVEAQQQKPLQNLSEIQQQTPIKESTRTEEAVINPSTPPSVISVTTNPTEQRELQESSTATRTTTSDATTTNVNKISKDRSINEIPTATNTTQQQHQAQVEVRDPKLRERREQQTVIINADNATDELANTLNTMQLTEKHLTVTTTTQAGTGESGGETANVLVVEVDRDQMKDGEVTTKDETDRGLINNTTITSVETENKLNFKVMDDIKQNQQQLQHQTKNQNDFLDKKTTTTCVDSAIKTESAGAISTTTVTTTTTINIPTTATTTTDDAIVAAESLINYNEGQWSPQNPMGRKQYDREQLLQLRDAKASMVKPDVSNTAILPQSNLMPAFMRNNPKRVQSMMGSIGGGGGGGRDRGDRERDGGGFGGKQQSMSGVHQRNSMKGMIHVNLSLDQDVKLNETDNAWRPRVLAKGADSENDPEVKTKREKEELIRRVRGILNKLTPDKFDTLVGEIIKLKIDTPDKMEDVMVLVFEKAIDEPNFSTSYARLCQRLNTEVKARGERELESGTKSNLAHFRNALLDKTEREFTQNVTQSSAKEKKLLPIINKIKECADPAEKAELEALLEEEERKIRRRSGGTVRFIGELFKISMLTGKIIKSCIETLLNPNSEDMLECLCKLLTTVGEKFEQTRANPKEPESPLFSLDKVIARMQAIASRTDKEGAKVSSRVRFMLQDVIDLRKNKWQSTRNEAPKTMEQIEKETKNEQLSSQYLTQFSGSGGGGASGSGSSMSGKRDDRGGRYNDSRASSGYGGSHSQRGNENRSLGRQNQTGGNSNNRDNNDDNTWHVQTSKSNRSLAVDTNKLEGLLNQNLDTKKMGGMGQFIWNNSALRQCTNTPSNPFAALSPLDDSNKSSHEKDRERDRSGGPRNKGSYNKGSLERDRYGDRGVHSRSGSAQASRENSSSRGPQGGSGGGRGMMNSSMQKSASHSKYSQPPQMSSSVSRGAGKSSGMPSGMPLFARNENKNAASYNQQELQISVGASPKAVFEEPSESDLKLIKSVVTELIEMSTNSKTITSSILPCVKRLKFNQYCGFLYYILTEYLHLRDVGPSYRRYLANAVVYLIRKDFFSVDAFKLSYEQFCQIASDLIVDIPELWWYIFEFTGPLMTNKLITLNDLWIDTLKKESYPKLGQKFLKTFLKYCLREIGPNYTRSLWKRSNAKWDDFMLENEVRNFIDSNNFAYIEDETMLPEIEYNNKESKEKLLNRIMEHVDSLLKESVNAEDITDYINGNIKNADIDKQFVRNLTTTLCNHVIVYKDGSYKLELESFQKVCIPILHKYVDTHEEFQLECLNSMQVLVNSLEHPRGLLNELFGSLYENYAIRQESFIKWRDSKDQSAGKGVAVKGLNPFFNHLQDETSDENN